MATHLLAAVCRTSQRHTARAAAEPGERVTAMCDALADSPRPDQLTDVLQALAHPLRWPADGPAERHAVPLGAGRSAHLVCTARWWQAVGSVGAAIDLAAAATPSQWLQHLEDRLLDDTPADPGPYAALAWWDDGGAPAAEAAR